MRCHTAGQSRLRIEGPSQFMKTQCLPFRPRRTPQCAVSVPHKRLPAVSCRRPARRPVSRRVVRFSTLSGYLVASPLRLSVAFRDVRLYRAGGECFGRNSSIRREIADAPRDQPNAARTDLSCPVSSTSDSVIHFSPYRRRDQCIHDRDSASSVFPPIPRGFLANRAICQTLSNNRLQALQCVTQQCRRLPVVRRPAQCAVQFHAKRCRLCLADVPARHPSRASSPSGQHSRPAV